MAAVRIKLDSIDKVKGFVNIASRYAREFELLEGKDTADGKSIMGILSLDLKNELTLEIQPEEYLQEILNELKPYMITNYTIAERKTEND